MLCCVLQVLLGAFEAVTGGSTFVPEAFGGRFPCQVRVKCIFRFPPISEAEFRSAIKDNYYSGHKFHYELNWKQVFRSSLLVEETCCLFPCMLGCYAAS